ncbi:tail-specific protease [Verrucomicrobiota bacterium]|nr:tail-specific protease [Verrucomicrobiota bacterium]
MASARAFELADGKGVVGVVDLPAFYGKNPDGSGSSPTKDVEQLLEKLKALGATAIIMDLRKNGGGLLTEAVDLAGTLHPQGLGTAGARQLRPHPGLP